MWIKRIILAAIAAMALYIVPALAEVQTVAWNGMTMLGPMGLLVDFRLSEIPGITAMQVKWVYNLMSFALVGWVAFAADEKNSTVFCVIMVAMAVIVKWFGWFTTSNEAGSWGIIIMCAVLSVAMYMAEKKRVTWGVTGGGDPLLNILMFLLLFQATVGLINGAGIFQNGGMSSMTPSICANATYSSSQINGNVQLTNAEQFSGSQSFTNSGIDLATTVLTAGFTLIMALIQLVISVFAFSVVIAMVYPFIQQSPIAMILLGIFQIGIYVIYLLAVWRWFWKPMPGDGKV